MADDLFLLFSHFLKTRFTDFYLHSYFSNRILQAKREKYAILAGDDLYVV